MSSTRKLLILTTYLAIFLLSLLSSPSTLSLLPTEIQCLKNTSPTSRKCAYCWNKPSNLHPTSPLTLSFPHSNSHLISTKSCHNFTCLQSLQLFTDSSTLQNSQESQNFLINTNSEIKTPIPPSLEIPQEYHSWRILVDVPSNMILPNNQSFWYTNTNGVLFYQVVEGLLLAVTIAIVIATTLCQRGSFGEENGSNGGMVVVGGVAVAMLYVAYNLVESKAAGIILAGVAKSILLYYVINTVPALKDYYLLSLGSTLTLISLSLYESLLPLTTFLSDITLFVILGILTTRTLVKKQNWSFQLFTILLTLNIFTLSDFMLIENQYYVWRVLRMVSAGLVVSLGHVSSLGLVEFEAVEGRPYWPSEERESETIVEVEESTII